MTEGLLDDYTLWSYAVRLFAQDTLGVKSQQNKPAWQVDNASRLSELSQRRKTAYASFAQGGSRESYRRVCKDARREIRTIMNTWWRDKAKAIQEAVDSKEPNALYAGQRAAKHLSQST